jgi:hypothetical protein
MVKRSVEAHSCCSSMEDSVITVRDLVRQFGAVTAVVGQPNPHPAGPWPARTKGLGIC